MYKTNNERKQLRNMYLQWECNILQHFIFVDI